MKLVISGTTPSKKNSRIVNRKTGRSFPSKRYSEWNKEAVAELIMQFQGLKVTGYPIELTVVFYNGDDRRHDLDNQLSSVLDTMVDAGIITDDDQKHISQITINYADIDRANPRCEIYLED